MAFHVCPAPLFWLTFLDVCCVWQGTAVQKDAKAPGRARALTLQLHGAKAQALPEQGRNACAVELVTSSDTNVVIWHLLMRCARPPCTRVPRISHLTVAFDVQCKKMPS